MSCDEIDTVNLLEESFEGTSWADMPVDHVMTSPVIAVGLDVTVIEAVAITRGGRISHIPVVDNTGKIVSVLTQPTIVEALYEYCQDNDMW